MKFTEVFTSKDNIQLDKRTLVILRWLAIVGQYFTISFVYFVIKFELLFFYCSIIIFIGANPIYRIVKRWLNNYAFNTSDLYLLIAWIMISVLLSVVMVLYFLRKGIHTLETS